MEQQTMTVKQALEQGYKYYIYNDISHYQTALKIEDSGFIQWDKTPVLLDKQPLHPTISADSIAETLADQMYSNWGDETGDDNEDVYDIVGKVDYSAIAETINNALKHIKSYNATDIKLIKE